MSRFSKLTYVIWHCQYHLIWVPKYRYRVLEGKINYEIGKRIRIHSERLDCELGELNVQPEHVHVLIKVPSKVSIWSLMGTLKGKTTLQMFRQFPYLKEKLYWGNPFWAKGFYFAHPYASWERGLNENINGLIRQYFPKKMDFSTITQEQLNTVMKKLNHRPGKTLNSKTPHGVFFNINVALQN